MSSTGRSTQAGANTEMEQEGEVNESNVGTGETASQAVVSELSCSSTRTLLTSLRTRYLKEAFPASPVLLRSI